MRLSWWYSTNAATNAFLAVDFDFAGVTRPHQATRRNENACPFSHFEQRLSWLGGDRHIIGQKSDANTHDKILSRFTYGHGITLQVTKIIVCDLKATQALNRGVARLHRLTDRATVLAVHDS